MESLQNMFRKTDVTDVGERSLVLNADLNTNITHQ